MYNTRVIPDFPKFKKLELADKGTIEKITANFAPYSDFNFVSLWSYNTKEAIEVSTLNGNIVIKFTDYLTNEPFYSFLGKKEIKKTINTLLEYAEQHKIQPVLKLIPEEVIQADHAISSTYLIQEDPDNHDYILSVSELEGMVGNKYGPKRSFVNRFKKLYPNVYVRVLDLMDVQIQKKIFDLFLLWQKNKNASDEDSATELTAIKRLLAAAQHFTVVGIGLFDGEKLVGFSINELVHHGHGIIHFEKADISYVGIFQFLKQQTAKQLQEKGYTHINYEQDLGIQGLRKAKKSYHPTHFLKKYTISFRN